jgi:hypothetical protein
MFESSVKVPIRATDNSSTPESPASKIHHLQSRHNGMMAFTQARHLHTLRWTLSNFSDSLKLIVNATVLHVIISFPARGAAATHFTGGACSRTTKVTAAGRHTFDLNQYVIAGWTPSIRSAGWSSYG